MAAKLALEEWAKVGRQNIGLVLRDCKAWSLCSHVQRLLSVEVHFLKMVYVPQPVCPKRPWPLTHLKNEQQRRRGAAAVWSQPRVLLFNTFCAWEPSRSPALSAARSEPPPPCPGLGAYCGHSMSSGLAVCAFSGSWNRDPASETVTCFCCMTRAAECWRKNSGTAAAAAGLSANRRWLWHVCFPCQSVRRALEVRDDGCGNSIHFKVCVFFSFFLFNKSSLFAVCIFRNYFARFWTRSWIM